MSAAPRLQQIVVPRSVEDALDLLCVPGTVPVGGGTDLMTLILDGQVNPERLIELGRLRALTEVTQEHDGVLRIGAAVRLSDVAEHPLVWRHHPVLGKALLAGATPQIRSMATVGGNLLQRTRCSYFRSPSQLNFPCNKRAPGTGCSAAQGQNRAHAILGGSRHCVATHPSDLAVALTAFDAEVHLVGREGPRTMRVADFVLPPGDTPDRDTAIQTGEIIASVTIPLSRAAQRAEYVKVRDRASYEFALVSVVAGLDLEGDVIRESRLAAGGVGTVPWRLTAVEARLAGCSVRDIAALTDAAAVATDGAVPLAHNGFKLELLRRTVRRAIEQAAEVRL